MSSLVRRIQRSAKRSQREDKPVTPYMGRGSKLGTHNEEQPVGHQKRPDRAPRGSRRGTNKMRGPFGKGGDA